MQGEIILMNIHLNFSTIQIIPIVYSVAQVLICGLRCIDLPEIVIEWKLNWVLYVQNWP